MVRKYSIYQINANNVRMRDIIFMDFDFLNENQASKVNHSNYELVYEKEFSEKMYCLYKDGNLENLSNTLEYLFMTFNDCEFEDYHARSLSISDIIVIETQTSDGNIEKQVYYVDGVGFKEIHNFFKNK